MHSQYLYCHQPILLHVKIWVDLLPCLDNGIHFLYFYRRTSVADEYELTGCRWDLTWAVQVCAEGFWIVTSGYWVLKSSHLTLPKSANILNPIALSSACIAVAASLRATRCCFGFLALGSVVPELLDLRLLLVLEDSAWNGAFQVLSKISDKPACVAARTPAVVLTAVVRLSWPHSIW